MPSKKRGVWSSFGADLLGDQSGQAVVEYALILGAAVAGAVGMARAIFSALDSGILRLGGQLEKDLKSGRAPIDIWKN
ncbi:MAG: hypothetical protein AAB425_00650 [Bdellovibrionota bacterium]